MCQPGNNVVGNSQISEAFSYELFARWGYTEPDKNEKELLDLLGPAKIAVDYVCKIYGVSVGVSVTRAIRFGTNSFSGSFAKEDVQKLLEKKLKDLKDTSKHQNNKLWEKKILHVWVQNQETANIVSEVAAKILKDHDYLNTLVVISKAEEWDFIFTNNFQQLHGT
ncbi:uncharacterized protein [Magallana gigas]|uniref:uncharacterized protein n=1 Tax=Magallana gigas TaxID=29159 RepID=UPI00333E74B8